MVVQDAVDATGRVVEICGCAGRAASCTPAFGALEGATGYAVVVGAFVASQPVAAFRNGFCFCVVMEQVETEGLKHFASYCCTHLRGLDC